MSSINKTSIMSKVMRAGKTQRVALSKALQKVENAKRNLLEEFDTNEVTVELLGGPDLGSSTILPAGYGNLFSFLGFDRDAPNPIIKVRKLLENIHLVRAPKITNKSFIFKVRVPDKDDLEKESPMEWESGRSWIHAVTYGIGTFSHYMFNLNRDRFNNSRAGTAIQVKPNLHSSSSYLTGRGYVIGMLGRFVRRIQR